MRLYPADITRRATGAVKGRRLDDCVGRGIDPCGVVAEIAVLSVTEGVTKVVMRGDITVKPLPGTGDAALSSSIKLRMVTLPDALAGTVPFMAMVIDTSLVVG